MAVEDGGKVDHAYRPFVRKFVKTVRRNAVAWPPESESIDASISPPTLLDGIFDQFDRRVAAGEALKQAQMLSTDGKLSAIGPDLVTALNHIPDDPGVRLIVEQIAAIRSGSPSPSPARRILGRIKSLFMPRSYSGPPN